MIFSFIEKKMEEFSFESLGDPSIRSFLEYSDDPLQYIVQLSPLSIERRKALLQSIFGKERKEIEGKMIDVLSLILPRLKYGEGIQLLYHFDYNTIKEAIERYPYEYYLFSQKYAYDVFKVYELEHLILYKGIEYVNHIINSDAKEEEIEQVLSVFRGPVRYVRAELKYLDKLVSSILPLLNSGVATNRTVLENILVNTINYDSTTEAYDIIRGRLEDSGNIELILTLHEKYPVIEFIITMETSDIPKLNPPREPDLGKELYTPSLTTFFEW